MKLSQVFPLKEYKQIAFVGAGGKTTALFQLARQSSSPIWLAASAHLSLAQTRLADEHVVHGSTDQIPAEPLPGVTLFTGSILEAEQRTQGVAMDLLAALHIEANKQSIPLLIEADGSRQLPLKAPADHEPPIPEFVDTVVVMVGLGALGQPLGEEVVLRPQIFSELTGLALGQPVQPEHIAKMLLHPQGGLKNIPAGARRVVLFNQAESPESIAGVRRLAPQLLTEYHAVLSANLMQEEVHAVHQHTVGIVLAAGGSKRFGQPKQLLDWRGEPFVRVVVQTALSAGLSPVIVVTGDQQEEIDQALEGLEVQIVHNPNWASGQSTSVKLGLAHLPVHTGAAMFLLADQPQIPVRLVESLTAHHSETLAPIAAPMVDGRRGNPVLFDRVTFPDFESITGDAGGRQIFSKHRVAWLPWLDPSAILDVDTPEDYATLLKYQD